MNSSPDAPWKDGSERSERWRETQNKGFPPRVSDGTGSLGLGGCGRPKRRPNGDVILIITLILVRLPCPLKACAKDVSKSSAFGLE